MAATKRRKPAMGGRQRRKPKQRARAVQPDAPVRAAAEPPVAEQDAALLARARAAVAAIRAEYDCWSGAHCRLADPERGRQWFELDQHAAAVVRNRHELDAVLDVRRGRLHALIVEHVPASRVAVPHGCFRRPEPDQPIELQHALTWLRSCDVACAACADAARALLDELDATMRAAALRGSDSERARQVDRLVSTRDRVLLRVIADGADSEGAAGRALEQLGARHRRTGRAIRAAAKRLRDRGYDGLALRGFALSEQGLADVRRWFPPRPGD